MASLLADGIDVRASVLTNTRLIAAAVNADIDRDFFASTACVYPVVRKAS